jgi:hypothetical protein
MAPARLVIVVGLRVRGPDGWRGDLGAFNALLREPVEPRMFLVTAPQGYAMSTHATIHRQPRLG